jgi:Uma2 family endonuclease
MTEVYSGPYRTMKKVYFSLPEGTPVQLINNVLVITPAFYSDHAYLRGEIGIEMHSFVKKNNKGRVIFPLHDIMLDDENIFQPDISFFSAEHMNRLHESGTHGIPDLVVEILSPATAKYDLNEKKAAYERFGVTEYWIVDPEENIATGYYLANDEYHQFFQEKGILKSRLLDITIEF